MEVVDISRLFIPKGKVIRFGAYCRVSTDSEDQINSFAAQVKRYRAFEKTHPEYELVDIYADQGISGTSMENRSELARLITDCEKGKIDTVLVKSVSRMARNTEDLLEISRRLQGVNVNIYFEEEKIDTATMNSEMILTLKGMAAQQESITISENLKWSYKKRMESGEYNCTKTAFGFKLIDGELVIFEDEAKIVRRIFEMYINGYGLTEIAKTLNREEVPKRFGFTTWTLSTIRYILNNERYMGDAVLQKRYTTDTLPLKEKVNKGEKPKYYVQNSNPAIVTKETFEAAQRIMAMRQNPNQNNSPDRERDVLSGMIKCDDCGRKYRIEYTNDKKYWVCIGKNRIDSPCDGARVLDKAIYETYRKMMYKLSTNKTIIKALATQLATLQKKSGGGRERIRQIDMEIASLSEQNARIAVFNSKKLMKDTEFISRRTEIEGKIESLRTERNKLVCADKNEEYIDEIFALMNYVSEFSLESDFDEDLFFAVVQDITVVSASELRFRLIGELQVAEEIPERMRCYK